MRGTETFTESLFSVRKLDDFVPTSHPLRSIRVMANEALAKMDRLFAGMYEADIKGTRYKTTHPKIVEFQIGKVGLKSAARDSFIFGAIFVTAIDITDYFMRDSATLGDLVGSVGMDIAKVAVASAAGYAIGALAVGTVIGTVALGPLVVAFGAAVLVGIALDALDEHFELTKRLSRALDQVFDKIDKFFQEKEAEAKAWLHKIQTSPTMVDLSQSVESWWSGATSWFTRVNWSYGTANTFYGI